MMPLSQAILLETFPVEEHTLAMTTFGIGMMAAPVIGPTLGGWITETWITRKTTIWPILWASPQSAEAVTNSTTEISR